VLGFSLGGFISQLIATKEPGLVRRIVLAGTGGAGSAGTGRITRRLVSDTLPTSLRTC